MKSLFIVFDGLDGSGKSIMIEMLKGYLAKKDKKLRILITKEPTNGRHGMQIREILKKEKKPKTSSESLLSLFINDRKEHLKKEIEPFLKHDSHIVICDRYYYSTIAFQHTQGIEIEKVIAENINFRTPDIAFILDLPAEIALQRIEKRGTIKEKFEQLGFMKELRQNFLRLKEELDDKIKIIDSSKSKEEVFGQIKKEIDKII